MTVYIFEMRMKILPTGRARTVKPVGLFRYKEQDLTLRSSIVGDCRLSELSLPRGRQVIPISRD